MATVRRARWHGALVVSLLTALLAVALGVPSLFFLGIVALGFVLVGAASSPPTLDADGDETPALRLDRDLSPSRVRPGGSLTVTLSVTNDGDRVASDVRIVDDPPEGVPVTDDAPAFATAVRPGETVSHEYELTPPRGEHTFGSATIRRRSLSATVVVTEEREPDGDAAFTCETLLDSLPVLDRTIQFVGQTPTADGGSGIEFFATREYRRGDPMNRIDWHRFARTGELTTVEYREERSVTIVFVIDDRRSVHRDTLTGGPDSYDLTLYAASRGIVASIEDGNRTGLAALSGETWIEPTVGSDARGRVEDAMDGALGSAPDHPSRRGRGSQSAPRSVPDGGSLAVDLERRLPDRAQVVLCTPLSTDGTIDIVESLRTRGRAVTIVAPDPTSGVGFEPSTGVEIAGLQRTNRIDSIRGLGATVVDWDLEEPIAVDLSRTFRSGPGGSR